MTGANDYDFIKSMWHMLGETELPSLDTRTVTKTMPDHVPEVNDSMIWSLINEAMQYAVLV